MPAKHVASLAAAGLLPLGLVLMASALPAQPIWGNAAPSVSTSGGPGLQQLASDARLQIDLVYRYDRLEHQRRLDAVDATLEHWRLSGKSSADRQAVQQWLRQAIRSSMPGASSPMPSPLESPVEAIAAPASNEPSSDPIAEEPPQLVEAVNEADRVPPGVPTPPPVDAAIAVAEEEAPAVFNTETDDPCQESATPNQLAVAERLWAESPAAAPLDLDGSLTAAYLRQASLAKRDDDPRDAEAAPALPAADEPDEPGFFDGLFEDKAQERTAALDEMPIDRPSFSDDPPPFAATNRGTLLADAGDAPSGLTRVTAQKPAFELEPLAEPPRVDTAEVDRRVRRFNADLRQFETQLSNEPSATAFQIDRWCSRLETLSEERRFAELYSTGVAIRSEQEATPLTTLDEAVRRLQAKIDARRDALSGLPTQAVRRELERLAEAEQKLDALENTAE